MKQVIVADDDPGVRDAFELILTRAGYAVTAYASGDILMDQPLTAADLFILDKQLSGTDGLEVCRFLKNAASTKNIPVILVSASPYVAGPAKDAGADGFLEKPFSTKVLLDMIEKELQKG